MDYKIAQGVAEERTQPRNLAELRHYLRMEYGLGTEPGFLLREAAEANPRPRNRISRTISRMVRSVARVMRGQATTNGRPPRGGAAEPTE